MNKKTVEKMLPKALDTLRDPHCVIEKGGKINKSYRSSISSFGAAVAMGSFRAAVAFFSKDAEKGSGISRSALLVALDHLCSADPNHWQTAEQICAQVLQTPDDELRLTQDRYLHAAVALKLAMNAFELV